MWASTSGGSDERSQPDDGEPLARLIRESRIDNRSTSDTWPWSCRSRERRCVFGVPGRRDQVVVELDRLIFELASQVIDRQRGHVAAATAGREVDLAGGEAQPTVQSRRLAR